MQTLDLVGRWILETLDYRASALLSLLTVFFFNIWRRVRYGSLPSSPDSIRVALGVLLILSGTLVGIVFLFTKPPAVGSLSTGTLGLVGVVTVIALYAQGVRELAKLFKPEIKELPKERNREAEKE